MLPARHFYMIRHGETEANVARVMAGHTDSPLTEIGRTQAKSAHAALKILAIKPQAIIHSHLSRARDTASILNEVLGVPIHEECDFSEMHVGAFEGVSYEECGPLFEHGLDPEGGESHIDFISRIRRAMSHALAVHDRSVLIVSHGGVLGALGKIYGIRVKHFFQNCHLYEFEPDSEHVKFPWKVWQYDQTGKDGQIIIRNPASLYREAIQDMTP